MKLIVYDDAVVAVAGATRFHLAPQLEQLNEQDPLRVFVSFMAIYALRIREGAEPGPYSQERAERFARMALIDDDEFRTMVNERFDDLMIAGHFGVPVEQVERKRVDLELT